MVILKNCHPVSGAMLAMAALSLALRLPPHLCTTRRELGGLLGAATCFQLPLAAGAYDSVPTIETDFAEQEALRKKREEARSKNAAEIKPYLAAIAEAKDAKTFGQAADNLSLWIIGKGRLPDGIDPAEVRDAVNDVYESLPRFGYRCEKTRDNNGVCFMPGPPADDAYKALIRELRKYSTRKGKGSLMSDGVSAANSAAF